METKIANGNAQEISAMGSGVVGAWITPLTVASIVTGIPVTLTVVDAATDSAYRDFCADCRNGAMETIWPQKAVRIDGFGDILAAFIAAGVGTGYVNYGNAPHYIDPDDANEQIGADNLCEMLNTGIAKGMYSKAALDAAWAA